MLTTQGQNRYLRYFRFPNSKDSLISIKFNEIIICNRNNHVEFMNSKCLAKIGLLGQFINMRQSKKTQILYIYIQKRVLKRH